MLRVFDSPKSDQFHQHAHRRELGSGMHLESEASTVGGVFAHISHIVATEENHVTVSITGDWGDSR
jgi:hypothetical protein